VRSELILVRHGETVGNSVVRLYGSTDVELSDLGRSQMRSVRQALAGLVVDGLWVSPLSRSAESGEIVLSSGWPRPRSIEDFREIDFGEWEGLTAEEVEDRDADAYGLWKSGVEDWCFPGGDSRRGFAERVRSSAERLFRDVHGSHVAVLHKGVVKTIIGVLTGLSHESYSRIPCELGSVHRLVRGDAGWQLVSECEVHHLGGNRLAASR
jgi:broad specificity phosphatase PhoE